MRLKSNRLHSLGWRSYKPFSLGAYRTSVPRISEGHMFRHSTIATFTLVLVTNVSVGSVHAATITLYDNGEPALLKSTSVPFGGTCSSSGGEAICVPTNVVMDDFLLTDTSFLTTVRFWTLTPIDGGNPGQISTLTYNIFLDEGGSAGTTSVGSVLG